MAGRYDSNPFDEEQVNPFSVSTLFSKKDSFFSTGSVNLILFCVVCVQNNGFVYFLDFGFAIVVVHSWFDLFYTYYV
jgi:hypothetical protein